MKRNEFLRNSFMALSIALLPKPLLPIDYENDIFSVKKTNNQSGWMWAVDRRSGKIRMFKPGKVGIIEKDFITGVEKQFTTRHR